MATASRSGTTSWAGSSAGGITSCSKACCRWGTLVYCPLAHWVWSDTGWFNPANDAAWRPSFDFAGGLVVHISSGYSALVCCLFLGKRKGYGHEPMPPHNLTYTVIGAALLWV